MSLYGNGPGTANDWHFIYAACDYLFNLFPKKAATAIEDETDLAQDKVDRRSEDATATETTVSLQDLLPSDVEEFDNRAYVSSLITSILSHKFETPVAATADMPQGPPPTAISKESIPSAARKQKRVDDVTDTDTRSRSLQLGSQAPVAASAHVPHKLPPPVVPGSSTPSPSAKAAGKRKRVDDATTARHPSKRTKMDSMGAVEITLPPAMPPPHLMVFKPTNEDVDARSQKKDKQRPQTAAHARGPRLDDSTSPFQGPSTMPNWFYTPPVNGLAPYPYEAPPTSHDTYPIFNDAAGPPYGAPPTASDGTEDSDDVFYDSGEPFYSDLQLFGHIAGATGQLRYDVETLSAEEAAWLDQLAIAFDARVPSDRAQAIPDTPQLDALSNSQEAWLSQPPFTPGVQVPTGRAQTVPNTPQLDALLDSGDAWLVQPPLAPGAQVPTGRAHAVPSTPQLVYSVPQNPNAAQYFGNSAAAVAAAHPPAAIPHPAPHPHPRPRQTLYASTLKAAALAKLLRIDGRDKRLVRLVEGGARVPPDCRSCATAGAGAHIATDERSAHLEKQAGASSGQDDVRRHRPLVLTRSTASRLASTYVAGVARS
ncbi:hypothetical protein HETIRDRAFT_455547 [Heterobasidion irregulare TC 32-1]|uniref:Uncharacterized protein n=1 Tax=Heterobasidion irregulare (strain TC 32-1) TaxID=747525 RepID=W4JS29_HETIT|nr:uncharacterized protein HETIRDRAFT_455547 [Heterobasidion irregulare TC 32-1]ETW75905.1 hypothetical protein HETIRDRAFT_455547 [Heterobasidion irregulare TC 32-1]